MQVHQEGLAFKVIIDCLFVGLNYYIAAAETLPKLLQQGCCVNRLTETLGSIAVAEKYNCSKL